MTKFTELHWGTARFLSDCCTVDRTLYTYVSELNRRYASWCHANHERPETARQFGKALTERGYMRSLGLRGPVRLGLGLTTA